MQQTDKKGLTRNRFSLIAIILVLGLVASSIFLIFQKPQQALAAVSRTGSVTNIQNSADNGSQSVTVPSDATLAVLTIEGYNSSRTKISGFTSLTLGGNTMTLRVSQVDGGTDGDQCGIFTLTNPPTGSQTLSWNWGGSTSWADGGQINVAYYKGVNTSNPIGSTGGGTANPAGTSASANTPASAGTLTASSGDAITAVAYYSGGGTGNFSWSGVSSVNNLAYNSSGGSYAETFPSGNTAVSASMNVSANFVTISAAVIKAATAGNSAPAAPTLSLPASSATGVSTFPQFQFRTTDADGDYLRYEIVLYQSNCSTVVRDIDQTADQTGWSGQDQQTGTAYGGSSVITSSTMAVHNYQPTALAVSTTYCWKARAIDPGGSNTWSSYSSTQSFTTEAAKPVQINGGVNINGGTSIY